MKIISVEAGRGNDPTALDLGDVVVLQENDQTVPVTLDVQELLDHPAHYFENRYTPDEMIWRFVEKTRYQGQVYYPASELLPYLSASEEDNGDVDFSLREVKTWFHENYGMTIRIVRRDSEYPRGSLEAYSGSRSELLELLEEIRNDILKYPPDVFGTLGISKIIIAGKIFEDRGGAHVQLAGMMPVYGKDVYLSRGFSFHHEIFHRIDHQIAGKENSNPAEISLYSSSPMFKNNFEWMLLDEEMMEAYKTKPRDNDEEQAEFARILLNLDDADVYRKQYLPKMEYAGGRAKFAKMKEWLLQWSGGKMNARYWDDLENRRIGEYYWK